LFFDNFAVFMNYIFKQDNGYFTWASGGTALFYDAVFETSTVDTCFRGETGTAAGSAQLKAAANDNTHDLRAVA
jgi:hypothetical protein